MSSRIIRVTFPGGSGARLAARLDLPAGPPTAYAVFAHCFTCGKDVRAASRLAAALTDLGVALLRFDFTGLGASEGEFANTDFASNVDDLVAAGDWLREHHRAPQLLVGHSLGGAAVISAAARVPEVRAVATIGAPSDAGHVANLLDGVLDSGSDDAPADDAPADDAPADDIAVEIAGRRFTVNRRFVADLRTDAIVDATRTLDAALLVLHSPIDNVVGIDHAARLYAAARHPKSFVTLDGADHLLSDPADAGYAATMIATWASRYVTDQSGAAAAPAASAQVVVAETTQGTFLNHVVVGEHRFLADEPESVGGFGAGPSPYDLLAAALGTCTSMTLRMYADRKGMPLDRVTVEVAHERVHAVDARTDSGERSPEERGRIDRFTRVLHLEGDLDDAQRASLLRIADRCPVHRTLEQASQIVTSIG